MKANGHTQQDVAEIAGVAQPQISRALAARRKRLTAPMMQLCRYAGLQISSSGMDVDRREIIDTTERILGSHPSAATLMRDWLVGLESWLKRTADEAPQ